MNDHLRVHGVLELHQKDKNLRLGGKTGALFLVVLVPGFFYRNDFHPPFPNLSLSYSKSKSYQSELLILILSPTTSTLMSLLLLSATLLCLSLGRGFLFLKRAMQQALNPCLAACAAWRLAWTG